mmetsp:Transcript_29313/g.5292  ORF Transcript_29313/g.5292 Transcript_29313/m.5292 type:complete len:95 (-) Transcript_29313:1944-2228(-)
MRCYWATLQYAIVIILMSIAGFILRLTLDDIEIGEIKTDGIWFWGKLFRSLSSFIALYHLFLYSLNMANIKKLHYLDIHTKVWTIKLSMLFPEI